MSDAKLENEMKHEVKRIINMN